MSMMDNEEEASLSHEEELIDSLFFRCDTHGEGKVHVYTVIQFLKNCLGNGNNEPDLYELTNILESDSIDGKVSLNSYRNAVKQWVAEIRNRCESTSFLEPDGPLQSTSDRNFSSNASDISVCIETSGIGDGSFHRTEKDLGELLQEIEDLKFQNRKFSDDVTQLHQQLEAQEEITTNLTAELQGKDREEDLLRKKIKTMQDLIDLRQTVMDENEELKSKLVITQGLKRDLDSRIVSIERENLNLESQVKSYESKWQLTCTELETARKELLQLQGTYQEHKNQLLTVQVAKASQEDVLAEKNVEIGSLKERLNQLMAQNEKLQEEKEDVQVRLAQVNSKLQRYQTKAEQLGLSEESVMNTENVTDRLKASPRLRFSTPLPKNSICMELKDRLNEDKTLPSPFCEKLELSVDMGQRPALLPTYMSAWEFELSGSMTDFSLEQFKSRRSLSPPLPDLEDPDLEKKLQSLKDLEKDALQKEIVKLYRSNIDLAEKCHKAELKEAELKEIVNATNSKCELEKQKFDQLEESSTSDRVTREIDFKDLWRLVHSPDEEDSTESDFSLSASTELLKEQIRKEIQALRNKLSKKDKALDALRAEKSQLLQNSSKKRTSNSSLVDALNIDLVRIDRKPELGETNTTENGECQCTNKIHKCNKSVPLTRKQCKHRLKTLTEEDDNSYDNSNEHDNLGDLDLEHSNVEVEIFDSLENFRNMHRKDIPVRFKSDNSADSVFNYSRRLDSSISDCQHAENSKNKRSGMLNREEHSSGEVLSISNQFKSYEEFEFIDDDMEMGRDDGLENINFLPQGVHKDEGYAILRRRSYRKAIESQPSSSLEELEELRSRSHSFHNAIEQGQLSPTYFSNSTVEDKTPEYESSGSVSANCAPKFFSTPLPQLPLKSEKSVVRNGGHEGRESPDRINQPSLSPKADLFKTGGFHSNKISASSTKDLSVLLEEGDRSSALNQSYPSSQSNQSAHSLQFKTDSEDQSHSQRSRTDEFGYSQPEKTSLSDLGCSVEVWTLSRDSDSQPNSVSSRDSGHSSSITSFDKDRIPALTDSTHFHSDPSRHSSNFPDSPGNRSLSGSTSSTYSTESSESDPFISRSTRSSFTSPVASESLQSCDKSRSTSPIPQSVSSSSSSSSLESADSAQTSISISPGLEIVKSRFSFSVLESPKTDKTSNVSDSSTTSLSTLPVVTGVKQGYKNSDIHVCKDLQSVDLSYETVDDIEVIKNQTGLNAGIQTGFLSSKSSKPYTDISASDGDLANNSIKQSDILDKTNHRNLFLFSPISAKSDQNLLKSSVLTNSYHNERNLPPSERILKRFRKFEKEKETEQNNAKPVLMHLQHRTQKDEAGKGTASKAAGQLKPPSRTGLKLMIGPPGGAKDAGDGDKSDVSEPPSPAICFFKTGDKEMKGPLSTQGKTAETIGKGPDKAQSKPEVVLENGTQKVPAKPTPVVGSSTASVSPKAQPEVAGSEGGDNHKLAVVPNLSKIRENHLAKRREYIKQNKMPQLSELSEKDATADNNNEKTPATPVIQVKGDYLPPPEANGDVIMPSIPDEFLEKLGLTSDGKSTEELSDQEIESKFTSLSLAFKTDAQTLEKRLEIQERSRDIAEQNVDKELQGLRSGLQVLNQICTDPQVREVLTKIQTHIDILEKSTARVSSRAEVFGAIQQEKRMSKAVDIMVHHVENIRRVHEREHAELEEARKLLQDSRSLAPSTIDLPPGSDFLSRRSASVCQNNMYSGKLSPQVAFNSNPLSPTAAKAIKLLKATRRRVSEASSIALPKVLGGTGAATLHPSASMDSFYIERPSRMANIPAFHSEGSIDDEGSNLNMAHTDSDTQTRPNFEDDARSRFQAVIASTTVKSAVANTLRRASLEKQNQMQSTNPQVSRDNSNDNSAIKPAETQDKDKQKNLEEEAFKKGYEQGMKASLGQDLSSLREQQNRINESLGEIMDSIDNQMEEPKSLKQIFVERFNEYVPKIKISGWRIRMTMGCFFIVMAIISVIISLFPVSSASLVGYRHYGRPPL